MNDARVEVVDNVYLIVKKMLQYLHKINPAHVVKGL